jgi:8-oxo-dGTP pyrophosphatase MutT (NUDIX family)
LTVLHTNPFWSVRSEPTTSGVHYYVDAADSVLIIPECPDGSIVLLENWRIPHRQLILEFPGGGIESSECPNDAAVRELLEETGLSPSTMKRLGTLRPATALSTEVCHVFLAQVALVKGLTGDEGRVVRQRTDQVLDALLQDGDAVAIAAWAIYRRTDG